MTVDETTETRILKGAQPHFNTPQGMPQKQFRRALI